MAQLGMLVPAESARSAYFAGLQKIALMSNMYADCAQSTPSSLEWELMTICFLMLVHLKWSSTSGKFCGLLFLMYND